jgi:two-component system LytT family response regulator
VHTKAGTHLVRQSLASLEGELDETRFIRIHRSTIVNVASVEALQTERNGIVSVVLKQGGRRRVSRRGYQKLKEHRELSLLRR